MAATDLNKLTIRMKSGDDTVLVAPAITVQGRVRITGGAGNDGVTFLGTAKDRLQIIGGSGNDISQFGGTADGKAVFNGGGGNDGFLIAGTFNDKLALRGGGGSDVAGVVNATFTSDVKANMGGGADAMTVGNAVSFGLKTRLAFGGGDDLLTVLVAPTIPAGGEVLILGGAGTDTSNPSAAVLEGTPGVTVKSFEL